MDRRTLVVEHTHSTFNFFSASLGGGPQMLNFIRSNLGFVFTKAQKDELTKMKSGVEEHTIGSLLQAKLPHDR